MNLHMTWNYDYDSLIEEAITFPVAFFNSREESGVVISSSGNILLEGEVYTSNIDCFFFKRSLFESRWFCNNNNNNVLLVEWNTWLPYR